MRDTSLLAGMRELKKLNDIKKYALNELTGEEKRFIEKVNKIAEDYEHEKSDEWLKLDDWVEMERLAEKYAHLKPFVFLFDPKKKIPKVFRNRMAFIIWTAWRANNILGQNDDIESGSLGAVEILRRFTPPFPEAIKKKAMDVFLAHLELGHGIERTGEFDFWQKRIFPYLEGKWKFKWELKNQVKRKEVS